MPFDLVQFNNDFKRMTPQQRIDAFKSMTEDKRSEAVREIKKEMVRIQVEASKESSMMSAKERGNITGVYSNLRKIHGQQFQAMGGVDGVLRDLEKHIVQELQRLDNKKFSPECNNRADPSFRQFDPSDSPEIQACKGSLRALLDNVVPESSYESALHKGTPFPNIASSLGNEAQRIQDVNAREMLAYYWLAACNPRLPDTMTAKEKEYALAFERTLVIDRINDLRRGHNEPGKDVFKPGSPNADELGYVRFHALSVNDNPRCGPGIYGEISQMCFFNEDARANTTEKTPTERETEFQQRLRVGYMEQFRKYSPEVQLGIINGYNDYVNQPEAPAGKSRFRNPQFAKFHDAVMSEYPSMLDQFERSRLAQIRPLDEMLAHAVLINTVDFDSINPDLLNNMRKVAIESAVDKAKEIVVKKLEQAPFPPGYTENLKRAQEINKQILDLKKELQRIDPSSVKDLTQYNLLQEQRKNLLMRYEKLDEQRKQVMSSLQNVVKDQICFEFGKILRAGLNLSDTERKQHVESLRKALSPPTPVEYMKGKDVNTILSYRSEGERLITSFNQKPAYQIGEAKRIFAKEGRMFLPEDEQRIRDEYRISNAKKFFTALLKKECANNAEDEQIAPLVNKWVQANQQQLLDHFKALENAQEEELDDQELTVAQLSEGLIPPSPNILPNIAKLHTLAESEDREVRFDAEQILRKVGAHYYDRVREAEKIVANTPQTQEQRQKIINRFTEIAEQCKKPRIALDPDHLVADGIKPLNVATVDINRAINAQAKTDASFRGDFAAANEPLILMGNQLLLTELKKVMDQDLKPLENLIKLNVELNDLTQQYFDELNKNDNDVNEHVLDDLMKKIDGKNKELSQELEATSHQYLQKLDHKIPITQRDREFLKRNMLGQGSSANQLGNPGIVFSQVNTRINQASELNRSHQEIMKSAIDASGKYFDTFSKHEKNLNAEIAKLEKIHGKDPQSQERGAKQLAVLKTQLQEFTHKRDEALGQGGIKHSLPKLRKVASEAVSNSQTVKQELDAVGYNRVFKQKQLDKSSVSKLTLSTPDTPLFRESVAQQRSMGPMLSQFRAFADQKKPLIPFTAETLHLATRYMQENPQVLNSKLPGHINVVHVKDLKFELHSPVSDQKTEVREVTAQQLKEFAQKQTEVNELRQAVAPMTPGLRQEHSILIASYQSLPKATQMIFIEQLTKLLQQDPKMLNAVLEGQTFQALDQIKNDLNNADPVSRNIQNVISETQQKITQDPNLPEVKGARGLDFSSLDTQRAQAKRKELQKELVNYEPPRSASARFR